MGNGRLCPEPVLRTPAEARYEALVNYLRAAVSQRQPVGFRIRKDGRGSAGDGYVTACKLTYLEGQPILGIAWRNQRGTAAYVSVPAAIVDLCQEAGVRWLYLRHDRRMLMWRYPLHQVRHGWLKSDGELYVRIADLESCLWRHWAFAAHLVEVPAFSESTSTTAKQFALPGFAEALR
jgi:hypothetical protein